MDFIWKLNPQCKLLFLPNVLRQSIIFPLKEKDLELHVHLILSVYSMTKYYLSDQFFFLLFIWLSKKCCDSKYNCACINIVFKYMLVHTLIYIWWSFDGKHFQPLATVFWKTCVCGIFVVPEGCSGFEEVVWRFEQTIILQQNQVCIGFWY